MPIKVYLMATLVNYMFRPLLSIFRLSSRDLQLSLEDNMKLRSLEDSLKLDSKGRNM